MQQIYVNKQDKQHFLVCSCDDVNVICEACKNEIVLGDFGFVHRSYSKKEYVREILCRKCIKNHKKRIYDEFIPIELVDFVPKKSIIFHEFTPTLKAGNINTFEAAISNRGINADCSSVEIIDHTKLAGKESFNGASIGKDMTPELELKDQHIGEDEAFCLLDSIKSSKPILPQPKRVIDFLTEREKKDILLT